MLSRCRTCEQDLPLEKFDACKVYGVRPECKKCKCDRASIIKWGATYDEMVEEYGNLCGICLRPETVIDTRTGNVHRLCVDHDHSCCEKGCKYCRRGLLCRSCNYRLGIVEKKPGWMELAQAYLKGGE